MPAASTPAARPATSCASSRRSATRSPCSLPPDHQPAIRSPAGVGCRLPSGGHFPVRQYQGTRGRRRCGSPWEEVALLAGVSVDYYTRLERGNLGGVSESVLNALARALQLDEAERAHLFDLARAAQ